MHHGFCVFCAGPSHHRYCARRCHRPAIGGGTKRESYSHQKINQRNQDANSSGSGTFEFTSLSSGEDYTVTIEAPNFKTLTLTDVSVNLNQITDLPTQLEVGAVGETVTVTAGGTELVDTTTTTLSKSFSERQVVELAQTNVGGAFGGGVNNLALIAANVSSSGGVGVGSGGSVGGQRPRNNNFILDGVDNNDKSVTGPQVYVSPEVVQEFTLLQNQFSAEFGSLKRWTVRHCH